MKKRKSKKTAARRPNARQLTRAAADGLIGALELYEAGRMAEAAEALIELDQRYPNRIDILKALAAVHQELGDMDQALTFAERLAQLTPGDGVAQAVLVTLYATLGYPVLAIQALQRAIAVAPDLTEIDRLRSDERKMMRLVDEMLASAGLTGDDRYELGAMHEQIRRAMESRRIEAAKQLAERFLARRPDFVPALNNLSLTAFILGRFDQALSAARRVLERDPDNFQALSNLARFQFLRGNAEEARSLAERLKTARSDSPDLYLKQAECLSYLGDDQGVLDAFEAAQLAPNLDEAPKSPLLLHLAGVASLRLGREKEARALWQEALRCAPSLEIAQEQLDDLRKPVGQREGPGLSIWKAGFRRAAARRFAPG
jgi:tetratricopeptide (TPR) repeat protein